MRLVAKAEITKRPKRVPRADTYVNGRMEAEEGCRGRETRRGRSGERVEVCYTDRKKRE